MDFGSAKEYIVERLITELPKNLFYHGAHHTFDVIKSVQYLARAEGVPTKEMYLLLTAAYFHDAGFLYRYDSNEYVAVRLINRVLPKFEYSQEEIDIIAGIIEATNAHVQPVTLLQKIMCDSDHDYLGRKDYPNIANRLKDELDIYESRYDELDWQKMQIEFLENKHEYYTDTAIKERLEGKLQRLETLKKEYQEML